MLGVHVTKESKVLDDKTPADNLSDAILRDVNKLKLNCAQIFTYGPRAIVQNKLDYTAIKAATEDIDLSVHSAYPTTNIWKYNLSNCTTSAAIKAIDAVKLQLLSCKLINAHSLVLHINRIFPGEAQKTMEMLKPIVIKSKVTLLLEMVSSKSDPDMTYETPEKITNLTTLIGPNESWWGWVVDTAHLWGAGVDIRSYKQMSEWLEAVTYKNKIRMFHLNGSSAKRGSGADKHEVAFGPDDLIWHGIKPKESGVRAIVEFAVKREIPIICEINRGSEKDVVFGLNSIKSLLKNLD